MRDSRSTHKAVRATHKTVIAHIRQSEPHIRQSEEKDADRARGGVLARLRREVLLAPDLRTSRALVYRGVSPVRNRLL